MCLGIGIYLRPLDKRGISALEKWHLDKLITLGLTNLPTYLPSNNVAMLDGFSKEGWLCVSSRVSLSEFADTFKSFFELSYEFPNVTKLAILLISGENASQYLEKSSKKVNKPKARFPLGDKWRYLTIFGDNFLTIFDDNS